MSRLHITYHIISAVVEPISSGDQATDYLVKNVMPVLTNGFVELCKVKPEDPLVRIISRIKLSLLISQSLIVISLLMIMF